MRTQITRPIRPGSLDSQSLAVALGQFLDANIAYQDRILEQWKRAEARQRNVPRQAVKEPARTIECAAPDAVATYAKHRQSTVALDEVIKDGQRLQRCAWSNDQIRQIPDVDLAAFAFRMNAKLQDEFPNEESFVTYWRAQRKRLRSVSRLAAASKDLRSPLQAHSRFSLTKAGEVTMTTHDVRNDKALREEWNKSPQLRAEFMNRFPAYAAFKRAQGRGGVRIVRSVVVGGAA